MGNKLPKPFRLNSKKDIENLFTSGKQVLGRYILIKYLKQSDHPHSKVIFVASKRKYKKAITRNSVKRKLKEVYRLNSQSFANEPFIMALIYIGDPKAPLASIEKDFKKLISKSSIK